jgi:RNA polymerase sigma-70 factor (ECF subfamily)
MKTTYKITNNIKSEIFKHSSNEYKKIDNTSSWGECLKTSWGIAKSKVSFDTLYNKQYKYIYNHIKFRVNYTHIAEELTQDVFIKANKAYDNYNPFKSKVTTWLLNIAKNTIIDFYRTNKESHQNIENFVDSEGNEYFTIESDLTSDNSENENLKNKMDIAIDNLKPTLKEVFKLYHFENKLYKEISEILNIPIGSVKAYLNRAKASLKESLKEFSYMA